MARIIDGELFDAHAEAERLRAEARAELDRARAEATAIRARAASTSAATDPGDGHVTEVVGLVVRAEIPGISLGEVVLIARPTTPLPAEVVGFRGDEVLLLPLGELADVAPRARVLRTGAPLS